MLERRPLLWFFILAYAGSWLFWTPLALADSGLGVLPLHLDLPAVGLINNLGLFAGPFLAAVVMTKATGGSLKAFLGRIFQWRAKPISYLIAVALIGLALGLVTWFQPSAPPTGPPAGLPPLPPGVLLVVAFVIFFIGGPLQEEPGWRGFALPRLQQTLPPTLAALLLGLLWGLWHLPLFLVKAWDTPHENLGDVVAFVVFAVALSLVMSWVAITALGSLWLPILAHNVVNWTLTFAPTLLGRGTAGMWPAALGCAALGLFGVLVTRGRLGLEEPASGPREYVP